MLSNDFLLGFQFEMLVEHFRRHFSHSQAAFIIRILSVFIALYRNSRVGRVFMLLSVVEAFLQGRYKAIAAIVFITDIFWKLSEFAKLLLSRVKYNFVQYCIIKMKTKMLNNFIHCIFSYLFSRGLDIDLAFHFRFFHIFYFII